MRPRRFHVDEQRITLPKGTRVVLKTDLRAADGYLCKQGAIGVVAAVAYDEVTLRTPAGRQIVCQRDQLSLQHRDQLAALAGRQDAWESLSPQVIYSAVVGSVAWGLADETSDEDVKGVFLLPFDRSAGLWQPTDEIHDPSSDTQYWEVQKLVYQGLRADAGTLELLWSPRVLVATELGRELLALRRAFVSQNIFGTFGRYAISQFEKMRAGRQRAAVQRQIARSIRERPQIERAELVAELARTTFAGRGAKGRAEHAIKDLYRSLYDRGLLGRRGYAPLVELLGERGDDDDLATALAERPRWKNAYNLLRLLSSGIRWLRHGEPLIEVTGDLRGELLAVKRGEVDLDAVLARADELAAEMERAFAETRLPVEPDYEAAHRFLLRCREQAAASWLGHRGAAEPAARGTAAPRRAVTAPPRFALPEAALQGYLAQHEALDFVIVGVVGSHSYGFPSRDSDFDLKAIHLAPIEALVGLEQPPATVQFLGEHEGLEIDFTSHEARDALRRLLAGDGNVLERILSPYQLRPRGASERLAELRQLALANLSRRFFRHYAGFFRGVLTRMHKEPQQRIKPLLYAFRVALSGVHLLREGELVADLALLLERYPFAGVAELIARKESAEQATIASPEPYLALLPELEALLERAHERSPLPAEPPCAAELDAWLRRWRWARPR